MNEYGKVLKSTQLFFLWTMHLESKVLQKGKLLSKDNNADLRKIGFKMRE